MRITTPAVTAQSCWSREGMNLVLHGIVNTKVAKYVHVYPGLGMVYVVLLMSGWVCCAYQVVMIWVTMGMCMGHGYGYVYTIPSLVVMIWVTMGMCMCIPSSSW